MKRQNLDSDGLPMVVERRQRTVNWPYLILATVVIVLVINWPLFFDFVSQQMESGNQADRIQVREDSRALPRDDKDASGFEDVLDAALRYDREGQRVLAATLFEELLRLATQNPGYNEQVAALLPRAADFFSRGNEIPKEQVEILYQDAYLAIKQVHGPDYYDYENIHRGLEKHYLAQDRFAEAASQTRMLLEFYRRYYNDNKDVRDAYIQVARARLDHNLLMARERADAEKDYQAALQTIPSSMAEPARMPASMGADNAPVASAPAEKVKAATK